MIVPFANTHLLGNLRPRKRGASLGQYPRCIYNCARPVRDCGLPPAAKKMPKANLLAGVPTRGFGLYDYDQSAYRDRPKLEE
jgi:hypothetical protein